MGVIVGQSEPLGLEERDGLRRDAWHRDRMIARREEVGVRSDPDVDHGMGSSRASEAYRSRAPALARAVRRL